MDIICWAAADRPSEQGAKDTLSQAEFRTPPGALLPVDRDRAAAALISILLFVSGDSQRGKADARLAQGVADGRRRSTTGGPMRPPCAHAASRPVRRLPGRSGRGTPRTSAPYAADRERAGCRRVEILDNAEHPMAATGTARAVAFATVGLTEQARPVGTLRLSTTTAEQYA